MNNTNRSFRHTNQLALLLIGWFFFVGVAPILAQSPAVLIRLTDGQVHVEAISRPAVELKDGDRGLVVWSDGKHETWTLFTTRWAKPKSVSQAGFKEVRPAQTSRNNRQLSFLSNGLIQPTSQLPQVRPPDITKGDRVMLTPYDNAAVLAPNITFRRTKSSDRSKLPKLTAQLLQGRDEVLSIAFDKGEDTISWAEIDALPEKLKGGLPVGSYQLRVPLSTGTENYRFVVLGDKRRRELLQGATRLADALNDGEDPLFFQTATEKLISQKPAFLCDAMDVLESFPGETLPTRLKELKLHVQQRLADPRQPVDAATAPGDPTQDDAIDRVRALIATSQWRQSLQVLRKLESETTSSMSRRRGLIELYRGVIISESGPTRNDEAAGAFTQAISIFEQLAEAKGDAKNHAARDLFRAHNNFGNFFAGRAFDRLHGHAFQLAAGVEAPLLSALQNWMNAKREYDLAFDVAISADEKATAKLNLARLNHLLAQIIRTLADPSDPKSAFHEAENALIETSNKMSKEIISQGASVDERTSAAAWELLALQSFQNKDFTLAKDHAKRALKLHAGQGHLPGCESAFRLLGVISRQSGEAEKAIRHFTISSQLNETLRRRYPGDPSGQSLAGFMSRRVYTSEQLVDLLAAQGRAKQALEQVELAKGRVFADLLMVSAAEAVTAKTEFKEVLKDIPDDTVVLEYFLTSTKCWLFVINGGEIRSYLLKSKSGEVLEPGMLIASVRLAREMLNNYKWQWQDEALQNSFNSDWQIQLHELYDMLLPKAARGSLKTANQVVIVPHHILHYFPFSALVTQLDRDANEKQMAIPRFLLDEKFSVSYAPSLLSWAILRSRPPRSIRSVRVIADTRPRSNLTNVAKEVAAIQESFADKVTAVHTGDSATVANGLLALRNSDLAFFGCHGQNVWDSPLDGHLLLDENLSAKMLLTQDIAANIVVLSACHSGLADRSPLPGDDLFGLERVLLSRGAGCVVSGIWLVDDLRGARITSDLVRRLAKGETAGGALAEAQRGVVKRYRESGDKRLQFFSHPHFWAVFKLSGYHHGLAPKSGASIDQGEKKKDGDSESSQDAGSPKPNDHKKPVDPEPADAKTPWGDKPKPPSTTPEKNTIPDPVVKSAPVTHGNADKTWIENPHGYTINYKLNGKRFALKAHNARWHLTQHPPVIQFDANLETGSRPLTYRLRTGSYNYFRELNNGLDLFLRQDDKAP